MKFIFTLLLCFFAASCGDGSNVIDYYVKTSSSTEKRFSKLVELKGENYGPKMKFGHLSDITLVNSTLIVQDRRNDHAFWGIETGGDFFSFQEVGDAPGQIGDVDLIKVVGFNELLNEISFFDYSTKFLSRVKAQPDSAHENVGMVPGLYWGEVQSVVSFRDSLIAVTGRFSDTKFVVINKYSQKEILRSENVNSFSEELSEEGRIGVAPRDIKYNEKNELMVLYNGGVNSIDSYSVDGRFHKSYVFGSLDNISEDNVFNSDYFYYYGVKSKGDVVCGIYLGVEHSVIAMQELFLSSARPEFHVYNLRTDNLLRFKLDRLVNACALDVDNNCLYCIEEDNEDQPIVRYEIPEIL